MAWLTALGTGLLAAAAGPSAPGLDAPVHATWTRVPLRDWTQRISEIARVPVVVDRRLDPTAEVTLASNGDTLLSVLERVAAPAEATVERRDSMIVIVPRAAAGKAAAAKAARDRELRGLPPAMRRRVERQASWEWPAASRPRDLVATHAKNAGIVITGLDLVPHDHLPAGSLPPLPLGHGLDLLLAQYDLRMAWSAAGGTIVALGTGVEPHAMADAAVTGRGAASRPAPGKPVVVDRYSLRLEAPFDQAISAVASRLGLEARVDTGTLAARGIAPGEIIRVEARDVSRDGLLDAVVAPLGLRWTLEGSILRVTAPPADAAVP